MKDQRKAESEQSKPVRHVNVPLQFWCDGGRGSSDCFYWSEKQQEVCGLDDQYHPQTYLSLVVVQEVN